jgi:hypothetical protein
MAIISQPTLGGTTLPFPSAASVEPVWIEAVQDTIGGTTRKDVMARKYKYSMKWDYMDTAYFDALESIVNTLSSTTFVYEKWPQCSAGVEVIPKLSARELKSGAGDEFYSSVSLECIEVNSRI